LFENLDIKANFLPLWRLLCIRLSFVVDRWIQV